MKLTAISLLFTTLLAGSFAQADAPVFDKAKWDRLVANAATHGEEMIVDRGVEYRSLSKIVPADLENTHSANYFSTVGYTNEKNEYVPGYVSVVSENWVLNAQNNWEIDQWLYLISLDGNLRGIWHNFLIETKVGSVLEYKSLPVEGIDQPSSLDNWSKKMGEWLETSN